MDCLIPGHSRIKTYITGRAWKPVICFYFQQSKDDSINNIVEIPIHWFGGFPKRSAYQTLNATNYLENAIPDDAAGIRWLNDNVNGQPVVLEASGDSYKDYDNRVSAMTGLSTVLVSGMHFFSGILQTNEWLHFPGIRKLKSEAGSQ